MKLNSNTHHTHTQKPKKLRVPPGEGTVINKARPARVVENGKAQEKAQKLDDGDYFDRYYETKRKLKEPKRIVNLLPLL